MIAIQISRRHGNLSSTIESFVQEKLSRLEKYLKESSRVEVVLDQEHDEYTCELILHSNRRGEQVIVKDSGEELRSSIDHAVEKLSSQLARNKSRRKDHHRGTRRDDEAGQDRSEAPDEPSYEEIVNQEIKGE